MVWPQVIGNEGVAKSDLPALLASDDASENGYEFLVICAAVSGSDGGGGSSGGGDRGIRVCETPVGTKGHHLGDRNGGLRRGLTGPGKGQPVQTHWIWSFV